ncbi:VCBS domain-containing protein [Brevundimonas sp.]|uniref:VCBS domain-containing protein n=1 Tax=Brevundimonas sp. TaxID=1871086 RepID=UPI002D59BDBE|nr:VCBS domain-containing protein [Brevundimonas sp.]HYC98185.1 VCBS domain-containing protein [Brevundimonas sp.]
MAAQSKSGGNTISGTAGADHLNGGAGADDIQGLGGNDRINGGSGNDVLDGGAGNDIVSGDAGDDLLVYGMGENAGSTDTYDGGSGRDTLQLTMTRAEWQSPAVQADIARYLAFLAEVTNPVNGQANNRNFTFSSGLTVSKFESLTVIVDGVAFDPRDEAVALVDDAMSAGEETGSISVDVLANDSVPDLIANLTNTQPAHGSVVLTRTSGAPASPDTASFVYTPDAAHWQHLAEGETATDTFTYTVTDSDGDVRTATVTVTITGSNDAPTLGAVVSEGAVVEDAGAGATGVIAFADVDLLDSHSVTSEANGDGYLGVFSAVVTDDSTGDGAGSVEWTFSIDDAAIQYLAAGETLTQTYTVSVSDGHGGMVSQPVTVTITGTNDTPVITAADATGGVSETNPVTAPGAASTPVVSEVEGNDTFDAAQVIDRSLLRIAPNANLGDPSDASLSINGGVSAPGAQDVYRIDLSAGELLTLDIDFAAGYGSGSFPGYPANFGLDSFVFIYDSAGNLLNFNDDAPRTVGGAGSSASQDSYLQFSPSADGVYYVVVKNWDGDGARSAGPYTLQVSVDSQNLQLTDTGVISFADVDLVDSHSVSVAAYGGDYLGALTASVSDASTGDGAGSVEWNFSVANAAVQFLGAGETRTQVYTVSVDDGEGGVATQDVIITVTGENDGPVISSAFSLGEVVEGGVESVSGVITFDDIDLIDGHSVSAEAEAAGYVGTFTAVINDSATGNGAGEITWAFSATDAELAYLSQGQTLLQRYLVTIDDGEGGTTQQLVNVTIVGTNDTPTITGAVSSGSVQEDGVVTASGAIQFADVDLRDSHSVSSVGNGADYLGVFTASVTDNGFGDGAGSVSWQFDIDNAAIQHLAAGETLTQSYTVTVSDGRGGTVDQLVEVTITGSNDVPTVTTSASHVFSFSDSNDSSVYDGTNWSFHENGFDFDGFYDYPYGYGADGGMTYTYGSANWSVGGSDGTISREDGANFSIRSFSVANFQSSSTATIYGYLDGVLVATQTFNVDYQHQVVTLDPAFGNVDEVRFDAPYNDYIFLDEIVIGSTETTVQLTELADGDAGEGSTMLSASGTTAFFDVDLSDTHTATVAAQGSAYVGGLTIDGVDQATNTVNWTFAANDGELQHLAAGQTITQSYLVTIDDGAGGSIEQMVSVTIVGTNDAPTITAAVSSGAVQEDGVVAASGTVQFADVDLADGHSVSSAAQGSGNVGAFNAHVTDNGSGDGAGSVSWQFAVDNAAIQHLAAGQTLTQSYTVTVSDGLGGTVDQLVEVTITGTNDGPVAVGDVASANEDTAIVLTAASLLANDSDVDGGAPTLTSVSGVSAKGASVSINAAGDVVYDPSTSSSLQGLSRGQQTTDSFTYTVTDAHGATSTATVTITVEGRLEAPVANPDTVVVSEGGSTSGDVIANDVVTGSTDNSGNVLVNGSFEDGHGVGPGGIGYAASLPGWTSVQGSFEVWGTGFLGNTASDGTAFLELDNGGGQDAYSSNLTTDVGREYTLAFDLAQRNGTSSASNQVEFFVNGVSLGVFTPPSTTFSTFTVTFIGSGSDVITFREPAGANDNVGGLIDNLRIAADADVFVTAVDGDAALVGQEVEGSNGGEFILQSDGSYTFGSDGDFDHLGVGESATTSVTYTVTDDGGSSSTTLSVTVQGQNDGPAAGNDAVAAVEDQPVTFDVRSNDSDVDGDSLTVTHINGQAVAAGGTVGLADGGFLKLNANGSLTYTPAANASGPVDFTYTVADGFGGVASASATINVAGIADAPVLAVGSSTVLNPTVGSAIKTTVHLEAGDVVSFSWDFVAHDYMPYNDFAFASVNGAAYMLGSVQVVGDYGTTGWKTFTFTATEAGDYSFGVGVSNVNDSSLNSHLLVDNLQINGVTVSSFESGFSGWTTLGSVGVQSGHDGVSPTHGGQMAWLDSSYQSASAIESFLGLVPGRLARIAEAAGQQGDEVTVPVSMTLGAGEASEDTYVVITGFPAGSTFNFGELDASGGWRVPASDLGGNLLINTPDDYSGSFTLTVVGTTYIDETGSSASTAPQSITVTIDPAPGAVAPQAASLAMSSKDAPQIAVLSDDDAFVMPAANDMEPLVLLGDLLADLEVTEMASMDLVGFGEMFLSHHTDVSAVIPDDSAAGQRTDFDFWS